MGTYGEYWEQEKATSLERVKLMKERDTLAEALAAVLGLADEWAGQGARVLDAPDMAEGLRAAVAAPLKAAGPDVAARLEAYGHLARLRAEVKAAQQAADPPTVAQAARKVAEHSRGTSGDREWDKVDYAIMTAFECFADLLEGK